MKLLNPDLETVELIQNYLANIQKNLPKDPWELREFSDQAYLWSWPGTTPLIAKMPGESRLRLLPFRGAGIR